MWFNSLYITEPLRGDSLLFTTHSQGGSSSPLIDIGRIKDWGHLGATRWFATRDPYVVNPAPDQRFMESSISIPLKLIWKKKKKKSERLRLLLQLLWKYWIYPAGTCSKSIMETPGQCVKICSTFTVKAPEWCQWPCAGVFIIKFEQYIT